MDPTVLFRLTEKALAHLYRSEISRAIKTLVEIQTLLRPKP